MLKIIWSETSPGCAAQSSASSMDSTLAPNALIFPSCSSSSSHSKISPFFNTLSGTQCSWIKSSASTPSRCSEPSVCWRTAARVKFSGQPGLLERPSFVATKIGKPVSFRNRPITRSLFPSPYTSAVSKKFTPVSVAARNVDSATSSGTSPHELPSCQVPRPTSLSFWPVLPKVRKFMDRNLVNFVSQGDPRGYLFTHPDRQPHHARHR